MVTGSQLFVGHIRMVSPAITDPIDVKSLNQRNVPFGVADEKETAGNNSSRQIIQPIAIQTGQTDRR
jgi:hypothetical protein